MARRDGYEGGWFSFKKCCNCNACNAATTWEVAAKSDSADLATGKVQVNIDINAADSVLIKNIMDEVPVVKLPCRLEFLSTSEAIKWLEVELKKDFIEQELKPVKKIPWGNSEYIPKCWAENIWKWSLLNNPHHKQLNNPGTGAKMIDVLKATIENRLLEKGIEPAKYISENYTEEMDKKKRIARGIKLTTGVNFASLDSVPVDDDVVSENITAEEQEDVVAMELETESNEMNEIITDMNNSISSEGSEDSFIERIDNGRRKLPSRQVEAPPETPVTMVTPEYFVSCHQNLSRHQIICSQFQ